MGAKEPFSQWKLPMKCKKPSADWHVRFWFLSDLTHQTFQFLSGLTPQALPFLAGNQLYEL